MNQEVRIMNLEQLSVDSYTIPIYQRNFAWGEEEISQLINDIAESLGNNDIRYHIGSLVVIERGKNNYEVIDGQQRLTVLALISSILGLKSTLDLHYDSRPEAEEFLK